MSGHRTTSPRINPELVSLQAENLREVCRGRGAMRHEAICARHCSYLRGIALPRRPPFCIRLGLHHWPRPNGLMLYDPDATGRLEKRTACLADTPWCRSKRSHRETDGILYASGSVDPASVTRRTSSVLVREVLPAFWVGAKRAHGRESRRICLYCGSHRRKLPLRSPRCAR
jgi:hypothetical protein